MELYKHQQLAVERLKPGSILNGGVGSGKTITSIAFYFSKICGGRFDPFEIPHPKDLVIITTAMKRDSGDWEKELLYFHLSTNKELSYGDISVSIDSWNNIGKYTGVFGAFFIFDEQRVTGSGPWVKAFYKICRNNQWILLSATPGDTWSDYIPVFVANGFYKNKTDFAGQHIVYNPFLPYRKVQRYICTGRLERLRRQITVNMEDQRKTIQHHTTMWTDYDMKAYKTIFEERWYADENRPIKNASEMCYQLRKCVNSDPSRYEALGEIADKYERLIIFYNFDYELEGLKAFCAERGLTYGQRNGHVHDTLPTCEKWAYLVQYTSGCEGWNCIETNVVVFFSANYSYKVMVQAAGRIDRINTAYTHLYFYHLKSKSSIDLAIERALKNKKKFNEKEYINM